MMGHKPFAIVQSNQHLSSNKVIERKSENGVKNSHENKNHSIAFKRMDMSIVGFWMGPMTRYKIKPHILLNERIFQWSRFYYNIYKCLSILL